MNNKYIFDVDGTLTPSRQQIDHDFERYMLDFSDKEDVLTVFTINPRLEETMINSIHQSEYGSFLALEPQLGEDVLSQIKDFMTSFSRMDKTPVSLCSPRLRTHFKRFTERNYPSLSVLSYNEVIPQVKVQSIGVIDS